MGSILAFIPVEPLWPRWPGVDGASRRDRLDSARLVERRPEPVWSSIAEAFKHLQSYVRDHHERGSLPRVTDGPGGADAASARIAYRWLLGAVVLSLLAFGVGAAWDRAWHTRNPFEDFFSPPHLFIYTTHVLATMALARIAFTAELRRHFGPPYGDASVLGCLWAPRPPRSRTYVGGAQRRIGELLGPDKGVGGRGVKSPHADGIDRQRRSDFPPARRPGASRIAGGYAGCEKTPLPNEPLSAGAITRAACNASAAAIRHAVATR